MPVDAVFAIKPMTCLEPAFRQSVGDERWVGPQLINDDRMHEIGDIRRLWRRHPGPRVELHYPSDAQPYKGYAEHIMGEPNVTSIAYDTDRITMRLLEEGVLGPMVSDLLAS